MSMSGLSIKMLAMISSLMSGDAHAGKYTERDVFCAVQNVWHEARGQNREEWIAITHVAINRTKSGKYPKELCDTIRQLKQFSWTADTITDDVKPLTRRDAMRLAGITSTVIGTLRGVNPDPTKGALFYHEKTISPYWSKKAKNKKLIGAHIYYVSLK